jgi:glycerol 3-phosphatase-2
MPLIDDFDHFLIDLDGVVYVGDGVVPGSAEAVEELRRRGRQVRFLTNNPSHDPEFFAQRLSRMGVPTQPSEVLPVAGAVLAYLQAQEPFVELQGTRSGRARGRLLRPAQGESIRQTQNELLRPADGPPYRGLLTHVVGSPELKAYLARAGLELANGSAAERAAVVIVGGHTDFDYEELKIAGRAARQATHFLVCGRDAAFPMPDGPWPGAGAVVAGIEYMAGREAVSVGKPEPWLFRAAAETLPNGGRIVVVGDNLKSDILGAQRAGYASLLVLSGHTERHDLERSEIHPEHVLERLADVLSH